MTDGPDDSPRDPSHPESDPAEDNAEGALSQEIRHNQVSAIVPEHVARGVFGTGAVVLTGQYEFIIDFLLRMTQPQQVAARIILPPPVVGRFIQALRDNLQKYELRFGPVPASPAPQPQPDQPQPVQPSPQELYEQLKIKDDVVSGTYANAVMIGHTATEFSFDFITTFFPRSAVARRVYLATPNVPRLLDSLKHSYQQFEARRNPPPTPPPPTEDAGDESPDGNGAAD